ncbi:hypothetical protein K2D_07590 [Planctomycetes bacterium K2D]|uniref:Uncharacterized protein n=1 Tax=Botrimarina mediterranea TaxID=2528022 RepID=A0A518K478_9BACT|nr:hypothetical protein Spa11_07780 [Botrimarina mediterranea]QDV77171.1 hypothetical protein K2D_07590 [Planctomycetes bacterium K2D]
MLSARLENRIAGLANGLVLFRREGVSNGYSSRECLETGPQETGLLRTRLPPIRDASGRVETEGNDEIEGSKNSQASLKPCEGVCVARDVRLPPGLKCLTVAQ